LEYKEYRKILLIEDDLETQLFMKDILSDGFHVFFAKNGKDGFDLARSERPDLILLELMLPKLDGAEICGLLRRNEATQHIPIIGITASTDFELHLQAFSLGADDFLQRPFRPRELIARITTKMRRIDETRKPSALLREADVEMNLERLECRVREELVPLSVLEFNLLRYFVENINRVLSRERILQAIWRDDIVTERTVDTHMTSLRKRIKKSSLGFSTLYGAGYILKTKEREPLNVLSLDEAATA
jgi:two-component system, OmpR family, alkaline phosphatase synthesis response regulator PhoP